MDRHLSQRTYQLLSEHNIRLKKSLGQNFLLSYPTILAIVDATGIDKTSNVLEIGPGIGGLTDVLAVRCKSLVAVEIDRRLVQVLSSLFHDRPTVSIVHDDALKVNFTELVHDYARRGSLHIVANLPYYITSPLLVKLLREIPSFKNMTLMMQKEVAERILAKPGTKAYGYLTLLVEYFAEARKVLQVSRGAFLPVPKVDSMVISLTPAKPKMLKVNDEKFLFTVIRAAFAQRRKQIINCLAQDIEINHDKEELRQALVRVGVDPSRRGETLTLDDFIRLANTLNNIL